MIISLVTYALFISLIFIGGKFSGFKNFNTDSLSLEKTKALRGIAALGVILHHIAQQGIFKETGTLSLFTDAGIYFVSIFFFCSGYGLVKSYLTKPDYLKGFIKNRIVKTLVIPYFISSVIYALFLRFALNVNYPVSKWIFGITGLTLLNEYAWFPIVLAILYLAFYLIYKNCKSYTKGNLIFAGIIILLSVLFCFEGHFAWWKGPTNWYLTDIGWESKAWWMDLKQLWFSGEWWVNTLVSFLMGIMYCQNEEKINSWFKKNYWLKLFIVALIFVATLWIQSFGMSNFGYWSEFGGNGPGIGDKFITLVLEQPTVIVFIILLFMIMMKFNSSNPITRFLGKISFETYMMNYLAILLYWPFIYNGRTEEIRILNNNLNIAFYEIEVLITSIGLGVLYWFICHYTKKMIK